MIYFNGTAVYPTLNYTVQRLFAENRGDACVPTKLDIGPTGMRLAASTVRDSSSGDVIVKIVNGAAAVRLVAVHLDGNKNLPGTMQRTVFGGVDADTINTDGAPVTVMPQATSMALSADFDYEVPANSLTIFRFTNR